MLMLLSPECVILPQENGKVTPGNSCKLSKRQEIRCPSRSREPQTESSRQDPYPFSVVIAAMTHFLSGWPSDTGTIPRAQVIFSPAAVSDLIFASKESSSFKTEVGGGEDLDQCLSNGGS